MLILQLILVSLMLSVKASVHLMTETVDGVSECRSDSILDIHLASLHNCFHLLLQRFQIHLIHRLLFAVFKWGKKSFTGTPR